MAKTIAWLVFCSICAIIGIVRFLVAIYFIKDENLKKGLATGFMGGMFIGATVLGAFLCTLHILGLI